MSRKKKTKSNQGSRSAGPTAPARAQAQSASPVPNGATPARPRSRRAWIAGYAALAVVLAAAGAFWAQHAGSPAGPSPALVTVADARYVGGAECASCHAKELAAWKGSDHDLAMQIADEKSVLGNFAGAKFSYAGTTSTFSQRDGKFFVNTDGPDGKLADYEIKYTFGVHPLQQYLIEFPGGRMQALSIAWDSRPKAAGRAALVSPLPRTEHQGRRLAALDGGRPELELHVRRVSFDQPAQELRRQRECVQDDVVGVERLLRGVPRPGIESCELGAQARRLSKHSLRPRVSCLHWTSARA